MWRGYAPADEADLGALHVVAGVELPGQAVTWVDPFAAPATAPRSSFVSSAEGPLGETQPLSPEDQEKLRAKPDMPFKVGAAPAANLIPKQSAPRVTAPSAAAPENPLERTMAIVDDELAKLRASVVLPFKQAAIPVRSVAVPTPLAPAPSPFAPAPPSAPSPFAPAPPSAPSPFAPAPPPLAQAVTSEVPHAPPALTRDDVSDGPPGLGAEFLAAMAEAGDLP